jgi:hypothetical protein
VTEQPLLDLLGELSLDPVAFVQAAFPWGVAGTELESELGPEPWQLRILEDIRDGIRSPDHAILEAVASGHGIGKSALQAWLTLWALCRPDTIGRITASTETQLRTRFWAELQKWFRLFIGSDLFEMSATAIYAKDKAHERTWRADAIPWSEYNPTAFQGLHNKGKRLFILFDEASEIKDVIWEAISGALTDADTEIIWCVFGNPTSNKYRFRQCFPGGRFAHRWRSYHVDSRQVTHSNKAYLQSIIEDWGIDSDYTRVRVLGQFPRSELTGFISEEDVSLAASRQLSDTIPSDPLVMGVDVARFGDDSSCIVFRRGRDARTIPPESHHGRDTMFLAGRVAELYQSYRPDAVFVDEGGVGSGVVDRLLQLGVPVIGIQFGSRPDRLGVGGETHRFANKRAEMWGGLRQWLRGGCIPDDPSLRSELTGPLYAFNLRDEIQLEKKSEMKKRGLASPDIADALALTFAMPVISKEWTDAGHISDYDPFSEAA